MQKWVQARSSLHHVDVRVPSPLHLGLVGLLHRLLGLDGGQVEEVVEHALTLGQVVGGVVLEAVLGKKKNLSGVDVDHFSAIAGGCLAGRTKVTDCYLLILAEYLVPACKE